MLYDRPPTVAGQSIGLLGGSFDPPHAGHVHITHIALRRFRLDRVWWLVSPGNPLKKHGPADIARRMQACQQIMQHPRVQVTDIEARLGTRYTADTLTFLQKLYPHQRFVWLMGADNLVNFHHWEQWDQIMQAVPVGVLARPGSQLFAGLAPTAQRYQRFRLAQSGAALLSHCKPPAWSLVVGPMSSQSSTALRHAGMWP